MDSRNRVIEVIDQEISRLQAARALLLGTSASSGATKTGRKPMSAEGRRRIAAAQRARWAKIKAAQKK